jgi:hypothetical protein
MPTALWLQPCQSYERRGGKAAALGWHLHLVVVCCLFHPATRCCQHSGAACFHPVTGPVSPMKGVAGKLLHLARTCTRWWPGCLFPSGHRPQSSAQRGCMFSSGHRPQASAQRCCLFSPGRCPQSAFHSHSSYHNIAASVTAKVCCMVWSLTLSSTWRLAWIAIIECTHPPLPALLQHAVID